jgi:hypothetical protein
VSFDCDWGHAQWVSWTLSPSDLGGSGRSNNFHQETRRTAAARCPSTIVGRDMTVVI